DQTGKYLTSHFLNQVKGNVSLMEQWSVIQLLRNEQGVYGVVAQHTETGSCRAFIGDAVVLATGGFAGVYPHSTNFANSNGVAVSLCEFMHNPFSDLHYIQFHPTLGVKNNNVVCLISEAVRGAGGMLVNEEGTRFMQAQHPLGDLAPRDVVSRAVYAQVEKGHQVYIDVNTIRNFSEKFPFIWKTCEDNHMLSDDGLIEVAAGAHFVMGGVKTSLAGESSCKGLFVIGEAAATGVHGANRLASNSLLECLVMGESCAEAILTGQNVYMGDDISPEVYNNSTASIVGEGPTYKCLQEKFQSNLGIIRSEKKIREGYQYFSELYNQFENCRVNPAQFDAESNQYVQLITLGKHVFYSALCDPNGKGAHFIAEENV
ncbi:MAG: FAD-binding protein, partial [Bacilli bacterium]